MKRQKFNRIIIQDGHIQNVAIETYLERKKETFIVNLGQSANITAYSQGSGKDKIIYILAEHPSGFDISLDFIEYSQNEKKWEYREGVFFQDYKADQELGKDWRDKSDPWKIKKLKNYIPY